MIKKKTKIIATISDRKCDVEFLTSLYNIGMNVVRINTAHQTPEVTEQVIQNVRKVSPTLAIIIDTKGPEVRTKDIENDIFVKAGDFVYITNKKEEGLKNSFSVNYGGYTTDVNIDDKILIDDGETIMTVVEKSDNRLKCLIENDGVIKNKKSINTPSVNIELPSLSEKDLDFIDFAIDNNIDFIAHSFVRRKEDVIAIQKILDKKSSRIKIIAKIENKEGVDNIDEILDHAYGIMIARGDLAIEIPQHKIPVIQKSIIHKCIERRKPVITATQMLHTMITNPRPTRAEVSDIANAIFDGTDAIMLSGETAYGKYPLESTQVMVDIAKEIESSKDHFNDIPIVIINNEISAFLAKSAVVASKELSTKAIIADTTSGKTIRSISAYRSNTVIHAMCYDKRIMRELMLSYGVDAHFLKHVDSSSKFIQNSIGYLMDLGKLKTSDNIVVVAGNFGASNGATFIEISSVENMLSR